MKPVIVLKSGRTEAGAKAANSHTASLAVTDVAVDALFESAGVIRVDTMEKLFDYAQAFSAQPLPQGSRGGNHVQRRGTGSLGYRCCHWLRIGSGCLQ